MKQAIQKGFTLIELIVVIVILGILAATALPKFVDLSSDARAGVIKGVEGAMRSGNNMLYGKAAAQNKLSGTTTVTVLGTAVTIKDGYAQDATELAKVLDLSPPGDFSIVTAGAGNTANGYIGHTGAAAAATTCRIGYVQAAGSNTPPLYYQDVTNCN